MRVERMGRQWSWPEYDEKLIQVFDWVTDCRQAIDLCSQRRLALQAGGATGVWPAFLADYFDRVVTVEPEPENYRCLVENLQGFDKITHFHAALGEKPGWCDLVNDQSEANNCGTWYVVNGRTTRIITIDSLVVDRCDLICLDIEGAELSALKGAIETIKAHRPVIMLEDKVLPYLGNKTGLAQKWLAQFGYRVAATVHRDIILCAE